jgi:hypothetical protein
MVRHVLGHTAGVVGWDPGISPVDALRLGQGHLRQPGRPGTTVVGTGHGSRATTPSARATSRARSCAASPGGSIGTYFRDEVAEPLGADFHIGLPGVRGAPGTPPSMPPDLALGEGPGARPRGPSARPRPDELPGLGRRVRTPASGGRRRSPRPAASATPARWPGCTARWPERRHRRRRPAPVRGGRRPDLRRAGTTASTSCSAPRCAWARASGSRTRRCPLGTGERTCFWGGWGGSLAGHRRGPRPHHLLRDEPHGRCAAWATFRGALLVFAAYQSLAH